MLHSARNSWLVVRATAALLATLVAATFLGSPSLGADVLDFDAAIGQAAQVGPEREQFFGWAGERAAAAELQALGDKIDLYNASAEDYRAVAERKVCLWVFTQAQLGGQHLPTRKQQIGDCVSWGFGHAVEYSLATHLTLSGEGGRFVEVCKPYLYGCGRVLIGGGRLGGDGSTGAWQSRALEQYGTIPVDADGVPAYSGQLARKWGAPPGPPRELIVLGQKYKADCKLVTTWEDAAVAISNGHPVAVCSGYGFTVRVNRDRNRIEGYRQGSWPHCMCFIAVDARRGSEALYCLNSWGEGAHARPELYAQLDGAPPGGFWVSKADVEGMLRSRDSYSVGFEGFVDRESRAERLYGYIQRHQRPQGEIDAPVRPVVVAPADRPVDWLRTLPGSDAPERLRPAVHAPAGLPRELRRWIVPVSVDLAG